MQNETQNTQIQNTLFTHDNLYVLHGMNSEIADLIYLDPPFNSKRMYSGAIGSKAAGTSFKDMWTWQDVDEECVQTLAEKYPALWHYIMSIQYSHSKAMMAYITYMAQRLIELHRILKETGSIYLHCDPTASHFLKILMDIIFGKKNFRNEIVWSYDWGGRPQNCWGRKHDIILMYSKSTDGWTFNSDDVRIPYKKNWSGDEAFVSKDKFEKGKIPTDVWDIQIINTQSKERTGYPTQKPLALLERIIKASSPYGGLVLDPFCGCATTCVAAQQLGRKWIGIDIEKKAVNILIQRLEGDGFIDDSANKELKFKQKDIDFIATEIIPQRTDVKIEPITPETKNDIKKRLFTQQKGCCNGCEDSLDIKHFEIDHIIPKAKGGGDYFENYQLLCGNCNRVKGSRSMNYLRNKLDRIAKELRDKFYER